MAEEIRKYVELKGGDDAAIEVKTPQVTQTTNYLIYNCLASLEFMISTVCLIVYVALNTSTTLIVLSGLGLLTLSVGCVFSYFAVSRVDSQKQNYALISFCIAALIAFTTSVLSLNITMSGFRPLINGFYSSSANEGNTPVYRSLSSYYPYNSYNPYYNPYCYGHCPYSTYNPYYPYPYNPVSSSVSYSYSYSYSYPDPYFPYDHTVTYQYSYSTSDSQFSSWGSISNSVYDYTPNGQTSHGSWNSWNNWNPYGSAQPFYPPPPPIFARSSGPSIDQVAPSMLFDSGKRVGESTSGNMLLPMILFVIQGLLYAALITQANLLKNNLKDKKSFAFELNVMRNDPQKI